MSALTAFFLYLQALGAIGGTCTAVWGEVAYAAAMRDKHIDASERRHLHLIAASLRYGMFFMLIASLGLVIMAYQNGAAAQPALTTSYWIFMVLALIVICAAWLLSKHKISHALGSAIIFTSWWFLFFLSLGLMPVLPFGAILLSYIVACALFFGMLQYARSFITRTLS
jgi:hypothetical protein